MPSSLKKVAVRPDDAVESEEGGVRSEEWRCGAQIKKRREF